MVETRNPARVRRSPAKQLEYEARRERKQKEMNDATRGNSVGGVSRQKKKRKRGGRGSKLKKGEGRNTSDEAEGGDSSSSPHNDDSPSSSVCVDADVDSDLYKSTNSSFLELESGNSSCEEAEADSDLYKSTTSSIMVLESTDGKDSPSSRSRSIEEDSELYKTSSSTPMESEYSVLSPRIIDADEDGALFSKTSLKSSQLEEQVRAVTQTKQVHSKTRLTRNLEPCSPCWRRILL
jgi:hypothetical protein